jgi:hypothetical protein
MNDLAQVAAVQQLLKSQGVLCVVEGSVKQVTLEKLMDSMNVGQEQLLRQVAWGTYLEYNTTTSWPQIGNMQMKELYYSQCGRYLVKNDGTAAKLNPLNSAYFVDGTVVDHSKGHTMWYSPDLYYLVTTQGGLPILWTSMIPIGGKKAPAMCIGAYKAGMPASALVSKPDLVPTGSLTLSQFWAAAQVNGKDWGLCSYEHRKKITMQFLAEYGNTSIQAVLGVGLDGTGSSYANSRNITTGKTISLGDVSGSINTLDAASTTVQCISYRGLENIYGQIWEFVQGILSNQETVYIWEGNKVANDKPPVGVNYRSQTRMTSAGGSYINSMQLGEFFDIIPKTVGGGANNRWADGHWSAAGGEVWLFGGGADHGSICGLSASNAGNVFSFAYSLIGARLAYYGGLKFVTGSQLNV